METLYERCGGAAALTRIVAAFYDRALASHRLAPYFAEADIPFLVCHQARFLAAAMGGPEAYSAGELEAAHAHLAVEPAAFDRMAALLEETLAGFGLAAADVAAVAAALEAHRPHIVRPPEA